MLPKEKLGWFGLVGWFLNVLVNYQVISRTGSKTERLTILRAATHETELGDHDFCLSRSQKNWVFHQVLAADWFSAIY